MAIVLTDSKVASEVGMSMLFQTLFDFHRYKETIVVDIQQRLNYRWTLTVRWRAECQIVLFCLWDIFALEMFATSLNRL